MNDLEILWRPWMPVLSITGICVVLAATAVFACWRTWSRAGKRSLALLAMRLVAILSLSILLLGPSREIPRSSSEELPTLSVLLDTSQSMTTPDCGPISRIAHASTTALAPELLAKLSQSVRIDFSGFDTTVRTLPLDDLRSRPNEFALGRETNLAEAVTAVLGRTRPGDALLVISDGRDTSGEPIQRAAAAAATRGIPVFSMPIGGASSAPDAALVAFAMQDSLLPNETGNLLVRIYQSGLSGKSATLRLRHSGKEEQFPVSFGQQDFVEMKLPIRQEASGQFEYLVALDAVDGEVEAANNAQPVFVEVMNRRLRVLVIEGEPFWDTRFLCQSLRKDEQVELIQLTQIGDRKRETLVARSSGEISRLPESPEEWSRFDVVVLGRGLDSLLTEDSARDLVNYVESGGQLVMARSRPYDSATPAGRKLATLLKPIEPVTWGDGQTQAAILQLSSSGRTGSWIAAEKTQLDPDDTFRRLPPLDAVDRISGLSPAAIVLAETSAPDAGEPAPAIVRRPAGRGAVTVFLMEGTWRWSLLTPAVQDLRGFYDLFWSNLVRWLAFGGDFPPGQQASLQLSRRSVRLGDPLTIDVAYRFAPEGVTPPVIEMQGPSGQTLEFPMRRLPGPLPRFRLDFTPEFAGVHAIRASMPGLTPPELTSRFNVYDINRERLNASADPLTLRMLSDLSGGEVIDVRNPGQLLTKLDRHHRSLAIPPQVEFVWDQAFIMWTLLSWIAMEWFLRRAMGLW